MGRANLERLDRALALADGKLDSVYNRDLARPGPSVGGEVRFRSDLTPSPSRRGMAAFCAQRTAGADVKRS